VVLLVGVVGALVPATAAGAVDRVAAADIATVVTLTVEPGTEINTFTPTTVRAAIYPATATGSITFWSDGTSIGTREVVGGQAVLESNSREPGDVTLTARFTPSPGSAYQPAVSAPVPVQVAAVAQVWLTTAKGARIPSGSQVKTGDAVRINVSGFPAKTLVTLRLGTYLLPSAVQAGGSGSGSTTIVVPQILPSSLYLLGAAGAQRSASFVVYIFNRSLQPTPIPSNTVGNITTSIPPPPASGSPTPSPTSSDDDDGDGDDDGGDDDIPSTGGGGTLPQTGADPVDLLIAASLAFAVGVPLLALGRRELRLGRHVR
jgi:hypothetical protein